MSKLCPHSKKRMFRSAGATIIARALLAEAERTEP